MRTTLILTIGMLCILPCRNHAQAVDGIAAIVDDQVIAFSDVKQQADPIEKNLKKEFSGKLLAERIVETRLAVVQDLINRKLMVLLFYKDGHAFPKAAVEAEIQELISQRFGGNSQAFEQWLSESGLTLETYSRQTAEPLIVKGVRDAHTRDGKLDASRLDQRLAELRKNVFIKIF
jgi:SurA N-terminal domain